MYEQPDLAIKKRFVSHLIALRLTLELNNGTPIQQQWNKNNSTAMLSCNNSVANSQHPSLRTCLAVQWTCLHLLVQLRLPYSSMDTIHRHHVRPGICREQNRRT